MNQIDPDDRLSVFLSHRKRLLRLAYRHMGSVSEAEDIVQDAWLRFSATATVNDAAKLLSVIVTRLCLDRSKSAAVRRLTYVGTWLPEPAEAAFEDASDSAIDISYAVMRALERLSPAERAAYFLHDIWDLSFDEIAAALYKSPAACRKLASRARSAIGEARSRFKPGEAEVGKFVAAFQASLVSGDPEPLKAIFAEDAQMISDSGGKALAARNTIHGSGVIARFLLGIAAKSAGREIAVAPVRLNDAAALLIRMDGRNDSTISLDTGGDGLVRTIYYVRNPDKLEHLASK